MKKSISKITFKAALGLAITFTISCSGGGDGGEGGDKGNDIANYKTVEIGSQTWMAENLNYNVDGSRCYEDKPANCGKYGRLYSWQAAMAVALDCDYNSCRNQIGTKHQGICPDNFHIPSEAEWNALFAEVGGISVAAKHLKSKSGWKEYNGLDTYHFNALPSGSYNYEDVDFHEDGESSYWWVAYNNVVSLYGYEDNVHFGGGGPGMYSVRCLQD